MDLCWQVVCGTGSIAHSAHIPEDSAAVVDGERHHRMDQRSQARPEDIPIRLRRRWRLPWRPGKIPIIKPACNQAAETAGAGPAVEMEIALREKIPEPVVGDAVADERVVSAKVDVAEVAVAQKAHAGARPIARAVVEEVGRRRREQVGGGGPVATKTRENWGKNVPSSPGT